MSVGHILLGLLEGQPRHGYDLKRMFDERFGADRTINFGQVYQTLDRLERDGLIAVRAVESEGGPQRKVYAITGQGVTDLERWLLEPEPAQASVQNVLFAKVVLALVTSRSARELLDSQRAVHLDRMRELTQVRRESSLPEALLADFELFHLEADLRWIEVTASRLGPLREELM